MKRDKTKKVFAIDFDGTLCEFKYPGIGEPRLDIINQVIKLKEQGHYIILWSCRSGKALRDAVKWCKQYGLTFDKINSDIGFHPFHKKIFAHYYVDDKSKLPTDLAEIVELSENS